MAVEKAGLAKRLFVWGIIGMASGGGVGMAREFANKPNFKPNVVQTDGQEYRGDGDAYIERRVVEKVTPNGDREVVKNELLGVEFGRTLARREAEDKAFFWSIAGAALGVFGRAAAALLGKVLGSR